MSAPDAPESGYPYVILFILVTELCERFAFYGFTGSLVCFFKTLGFPSDLATELISLFGSIVYLTPVLGAYVADVYLGRFKTIAIFCAIYILGLALTTAGAWPTYGDHAIPRDTALLLSMVGLFAFVTVGAGGIKSNVVVLGADQFKLPEQEHHQASFFNFFYWCINIGATAAFLFLTNVALYGLGSIVSPRFGFFASFAIPLGAFVLALLAFVAGERRYVQRPPEGSAVTAFVQTLSRAAWRHCTLSRSGPGSGLYLVLACIALPAAFCSLVGSFFLPPSAAHDACAIGGLALIALGLGMLIRCGASTDWLYAADPSDDGSAADGGRGGGGVDAFAAVSIGVSAIGEPSDEADAAAVVRVLPLASCVVVFWMVYSQMSSNFQLQGFQMDLHTMGTELSPATLNVFDSVAIMLLIPVVDRILYPALASCHIRLSMLSKMGIGFIFALLSVLTAGFVERMRRASPLLPPFDVPELRVPELALSNGGLGVIDSGGGAGSRLIAVMATATTNTSGVCGGGGIAPPPMRSLSIWWQTPQYILIGLGEIFAAITCYELFYSTVPPHMRSVCQSINLLCTAFGSLAAAGLNSACAVWIPNNLDNGHLDYVFFLLAALMGLNLMIFVAVSHTFDAEAAAAAGRGDYARHPTLSVADSVGPGIRITPQRFSGLRGSTPSHSRASHPASSRAGSVAGRDSELANPLIDDGRR